MAKQVSEVRYDQTIDGQRFVRKSVWMTTKQYGPHWRGENRINGRVVSDEEYDLRFIQARERTMLRHAA